MYAYSLEMGQFEKRTHIAEKQNFSYFFLLIYVLCVREHNRILCLLVLIPFLKIIFSYIKKKFVKRLHLFVSAFTLLAYNPQTNERFSPSPYTRVFPGKRAKSTIGTLACMNQD